MKTYQMNSDQIRAWLAIEGYVCLRGRREDNIPWLQLEGKHHVACYDYKNLDYKVTGFFERPKTVDVYPLDALTDDELGAMLSAIEKAGVL